MKKFLLLICALLGTVGAWAGTVYTVTDPVQVTDLANLSSSKYYILKNCGSSFYNYYDATNSQLDAKSSYDYSSVVKLNYDGENVTIQQVSTGTFYQGLTNDTRVSLGASPVNFTFNTDGVESGQFRFANNNLYMNRYGGGTQYPTGAATSFAGNFSRWNIYEVTLTSTTVINSISDLDPNKCYTISTVDRGAWVVPNSATQVTSTTKAELAFSKDDTKQQFAFVSSNGKWFLYSVAAGKFISKRGSYTILSSVPNDDVTILASSGSTDYPIVIAFQNGAYQAGISNGYNPAVITSYNDLTDDGNRAVITEAGDFDPTTVQAAITNFLAEPSVTSGNYYRLWNLGGSGAYIAPSSFVSTATQAESVILRITEVGTTPVGKKVYSLYDEKNSKYLSYTDVAKSTGNNTDRFAWTDAATNSKFVFTTARGSNNINIRPAAVADDNWVRLWNDGGGYNLILWTDNSSDVTNTGAYKWNLTDLTINVNYKTMFSGEQKGSTTIAKSYVGGSPILPASLAVPAFCEYTFDKETVTAADELITANVTWNGPVNYTADATSPQYYNLNIRSKYLVYDDNATGDVTLNATSTPFNPDASWAFIGDPYNGFKIINQSKGTDSYLTYTSVVEGRNGGNNNIQFVDNSNFSDQYWMLDENTGGFVLRMKNNPNIYFHHDNTSNFLRTCSKGEYGSVHNDAGSTIVASMDEDELIALYNDMKNLVFASGVGEYSTTYVGTDGAAADIASIGTIIDMKVTAQYPSAYNTLMDIKSKSTLNLPTPSFYRIEGNTSGKYLASGFASNSKFPMTTAKDATTIFYYDGTKLVNFGSGMCNGVTGSGTWTWVTENSASVVTFKDGLTYGGYAIQTGTGHFYDNGDGNPNSADRGGNITDMSTQDTRYRSWKLTEVTTLPVNISSALYATLYAPVALTIPSGVKAYIASDKGDYLQLTAIEGGTIPANTGVILAGDAGTYNFVITTGGSVGSNALTGTVAAINRPENSYILSTSGGTNVGFYKDGATTIPGFKAYLPASSGGSVKAFRFDDDEDAIKSLFETQDNAEIYNLAGQRLSKLQKGVNIVNGKKVLVK